MRTNELVEAYVRGAESGKASGGRLYIEGTKLINYHTCLAEIKHGVFYVNMTKYSPTTSKHQNRLLRELRSYGATPIILEAVPEGTQSLSSLRVAYANN
jgi:hypothetical protein